MEPGLPLDETHGSFDTEELIEKGLVELVPRSQAPPAQRASDWARLSPLGLDVARLLLGRGSLPDWLR
jgi:hypothetical protein